MRSHLTEARGARLAVILLGEALLGGLVLVGSAAAVIETNAAIDLYVSPSGTDSAACGTQAAPCRNVDYAVNKALSGATIRVAGGAYLFASVANLCGGVPIQSVVCVVDKSVTIRGGFASSNWAFDPVANPTVIDGQSTRRGVFVYSSGSPSVRLTMANITIQNGRAQGTLNPFIPAGFGGGMNVEAAAVTLDGVMFQNNQAIGADTGSEPGGGAAGSALSIRSSLGGAISLLSNVRFENNRSSGGQGPEVGGVVFGALFVYASIVNVENSSFISNYASAGSSTGSGLFNGERADALGGAVGVEGAATVSLVRVSATGNQVLGGVGTQYGGGAFGAAVFAENSTVAIADSLFQSNVAHGAASANGGFAAGGGVLLFNSNGTIDRTRILANHATGGDSLPGQLTGTGGGGGLYLWRSDPAVTLQALRVTNTVIGDNIVELGQGGVNPGGGGGGLQVQGLSANLAHVTFARNLLGSGLVAGQAMVVVPGGSAASVNLDHSVVADHVASTTGATAFVVTQGNTLNLNGGAFSGNTNNTNINNIPMLPGTITGLASMLTVASPGFVSPGSPNYNYHITSGSSLRSAAMGSITAVDMDFQPRVDGLPDIGADEYVAATCTPGGATDTDADGIPDNVEQSEGTHPCAKDNDFFGSVRLFAMQQYRDFLGREGDTDGLLAWVGMIGGGTSRAAVAKAFFDSPEFQGAIAPVARLYFAYFDRIPDQVGLQYWIAQYKAGMSLDAISEVFATSPEFQITYGPLTNTQFVTLLYHNVLGREPDPIGLAYWTNQLNTGPMTRGQVMVGFSESPEYTQRSYNWVFVTMIYYGMLRRVPEQTGFDYWVAQLYGGASGVDLVNDFLGAGEYRARLLP